jgi:peroxisomal 2,4-dienoyl-CoA reductase
LDGQVALVTGGATGIGKEICRVLGAHGAKVAMASRKRENLEAAVEELVAEGIDAEFAVCDVRDAQAVRAAVDQILESRHRLDIVVNNAAGNFPAPMSKISPNGFKAVVDIDLLGTYNVTRAAFDAT